MQPKNRIYELVNMMRAPDDETEALLIDLGLAFLEEQLMAAETRISQRQEQLNRSAAASSEADDELVAVYRQEQAVLQALIEASRETPFVQVVMARQEHLQQRQHQLCEQNWAADQHARDARYTLHLEQQILVNLLQAWLKDWWI